MRDDINKINNIIVHQPIASNIPYLSYESNLIKESAATVAPSLILVLSAIFLFNGILTRKCRQQGL